MKTECDIKPIGESVAKNEIKFLTTLSICFLLVFIFLSAGFASSHADFWGLALQLFAVVCSGAGCVSSTRSLVIELLTFIEQKNDRKVLL